MEEEDTNSTIDYQIIDDIFHGFTDASDSFEFDGQISEEISPSHSFNNITNAFLDSDSKTSINNKHKSKRKLSSNSLGSKRLHDQTNDRSEITTVSDDEPINNNHSLTSDSPVPDSSFLSALYALLIKIIGFQLNLLLSFVTFPGWLAYYSYMFIIHPFSTTSLAKDYILDKLSTVFGWVKSIMHVWIRNNESTWKLCFQIGWGLLWSVYIGFILISLLVFAFVIGGVIMKCILVESIEITEQLSFDYTEDSPVAFVPLMSCPDPSFLECSELIKAESSGEARVIPLDHKVLTTVSLTLPESYYNRNLGVFQVRVDFLSGNGQRLASSRQPCMLHYKSLPIRLMLTFLKIAPLVIGYSSESQKLNIKFRGYTERNEPTSCLRVILEQRAEFTRGAGIPEIYEASLKLESLQPLLQRILWHWKWTIYIWVSIMMFVVELLFTLVCCTPVIFPWIQPRGVSVTNNEPLQVKNSLLAMAEPVVE